MFSCSLYYNTYEFKITFLQKISCADAFRSFALIFVQFQFQKNLLTNHGTYLYGTHLAFERMSNKQILWLKV